jgi:hypothetical protein
MKKIVAFITLLLASASAAADPISAIASIATIIGSGATVAGIAAGALSLTQGLMLAGGALGLAGALTQNKKLQTLGGVLGLAGGLGQLAGKLTSAASAAGEVVGAGAEQLGQTAAAVAPAEQVAAEVGNQAANAAADVATDVATADMNSINEAMASANSASGPAAAQAAQGAPEVTGFRPSQNYGPGAGSGLADAAKTVGAVIRDNKELVNLGSGLIKGAMESRSLDSAADRRERFEREAQERFSASVSGVNQPGQFIRPGVDVTSGRQPQNPIRYIPRRGLIRSARGG